MSKVTLCKQYVSSAIASFGCVCAGTVLAWTSPALPQLLQDATLNVSDVDGGLIGSIVAVGAMVSAFPAGYAADSLGRRATLRYLSVPFLLGWLLIAFAKGVPVLLTARFLGGFASGAICVVVPIYVSEIASVSVRGILGSFFQMCFCAGILLVNVVGALMPWRDLSLCLGVPPLLYLVGLCFAPETSSSTTYEEQTLTTPKTKRTLWANLKDRRNRRTLAIAMGLVGFQQLSGVNAVIFYTATIFSSTGTALSPAVSTIIVALVQLVCSCTSAILIERLNRRLYLIASALGMCFSLLLLGWYFQTHLDPTPKLPGYDYVPLFSMVLFIVSFSIGFGPIPWLMLGEVFSAEFKAVGCGFATLANWGLVFVVTAVFPVICGHLGEHNTFYLFTLLNLAAAFFAVYCVPETRGRTYDEIQNSI